MKKIILFSALALFVMLTISCDVETNYTVEGHYGKVIVHNEASSGATITRIIISDSEIYSNKTHYNERVSISPGKNSNEYELELKGFYGQNSSYFNVTITLDDNATKTKSILAYEDIANHLYYNGKDLVERK
jgi:hypothetical protein